MGGKSGRFCEMDEDDGRTGDRVRGVVQAIEPELQF